MKTLFLGASGFVGKALIQSISQTNTLTTLTHKEVLELFDYELDRREYFKRFRTYDQVLKGDFERIIDCSWAGLPDISHRNNQINLKLKERLVSRFSNYNVKEYVGFGSCLEYGSTTGKVLENCEGTQVGQFGQTKLEILDLIRDSGIKYKWFRPFYLIGARQHPNSLLRLAVDAISAGNEFEPRDPSITNDYIPIDAAAEMIKAVIESDTPDGISNIGSGEGNSVNIVRLNFGMRSREIQAKEGMVADISKLILETGHTPMIDFSSSVTRIIKEIREI